MNSMNTQIGKYLDHFPAYFDDEHVRGMHVFQTMMKRAQKGAIPPANIYKLDNGAEVTMPVAGKKEKDFQLMVQGPHLILVCESNQDTHQNRKPISREYNFDKFSRVFRFPFKVDLDKVGMTYKNGELKIRIEFPGRAA